MFESRDWEISNEYLIMIARFIIKDLAVFNLSVIYLIVLSILRHLSYFVKQGDGATLLIHKELPSRNENQRNSI